MEEYMLASVSHRIKAVSTRKPFTLLIEWRDGSCSKVDLTGLTHRSKNFGVFASDRAAFAQVQPDEFGTGIEWSNGLDYSADSLRTMAEEQTMMSGASLVRFEEKHGLNTMETANLFEVSKRTIQSMRHIDRLPLHFSIALRLFENDPAVFAAHFRPVATKPRGRPKSAQRAIAR
jgi:hypothetical protein